MIPTFSTAITYGSISRVASTHIDSNDFGWLKGRDYTWEDFFTPLTGKFIVGDNFHAPSPAFTYMCTVISLILLLILTWYFDHVISANRGVGSPLYFPFTRKYWSTVFRS
jgi:hypothetical protein